MKTPGAREPIVVREASWTTIVLVLLVTFGLITTVFLPQVITRLLSLGEGLANLVIFSGILVLVVGGVAIGFGGLRLRDLGLRFDKLAEAVLVVACVWIAFQAAHALTGFLSYGTVRWDASWQRFGITDRLLWFGVMLFGTALAEETIFRGFFYPQLYLRCSGSHRTRFWIAAVAAAVLFGLFHVPRHITFTDMSASALAVRILMHALGGLLATAMYLRTRNLLIMIGLHGIENAPTRLFESQIPSEALLLLELVLLVSWPWLTRRSEQRGMAAIFGESVARTSDHQSIAEH